MQPIYTYTLNPNNAKSVGGGGRINEKGAYKGTITRAEVVQSTKGTQGIELSFKAESGQTADYLTLWTINSQGQELQGRKIIDALMTCLSLRTINATNATIKKYDHETRQERAAQAVIFPELMNKPIGLLLVREEYQKDNGTDWKMVVVGCFDSKGRTPKEVLEQGQPEQLAKWVATLQDRPLKKAAHASGGYAAASGRTSASSRPASNFDDNDDDIPF